MDLNEYLTHCKRTSRNVLTIEEKLSNFTLGLVGEVGEVFLLFNKEYKPKIVEIEKEIGDVLWYTTGLMDLYADFTDLNHVLSYRLRSNKLMYYYDIKTKTININEILANMILDGTFIADETKKKVFHNKTVDVIRIIGTLADIYFLCENLLACFNLTIENTLIKNVEKLKLRYPDGFSSELAALKLDEKNANLSNQPEL